VAETVLREGNADLVSMARPLLADPEFPNKAASGREDEINTCIACNQACLDRVFENKRATCLVNPRAGRETELVYRKVTVPRRIAVIGAGPAGLACATVAAERGHRVTLFEREQEIGGQFRYAREVPGKEDFHDTLRYFRVRIARLGIDLRLGTHVTAADLERSSFDEIVLASGVRPRIPRIPGIEHPKVISYPALLSGERVAGERVAIVGAGGIGFDVATFLTSRQGLGIEEFCEEWGIDRSLRQPGGLLQAVPDRKTPRRIFLLQRKTSRLGAGLGKTTGWIHRRSLIERGVEMRAGVTYERIDDAGLHIKGASGPEVLDVDSVILCAGQESRTELLEELPSATRVRIIGGARLAAELDAERAIREGSELAARF
jgi:2,4-dienoyl-CoA reductase (NADPH2)